MYHTPWLVTICKLQMPGKTQTLFFWAVAPCLTSEVWRGTCLGTRRKAHNCTILSVKMHQNLENLENLFGWILVILALVTFNLTCSSFVPWTTAASVKWRHNTRWDFGNEIGIYLFQTLHSNGGWLLMHRNTLMGLNSNWYTKKLKYKERASPVGKYCSGVTDNGWLYILLSAYC